MPGHLSETGVIPDKFPQCICYPGHMKDKIKQIWQGDQTATNPPRNAMDVTSLNSSIFSMRSTLTAETMLLHVYRSAIPILRHCSTNGVWPARLSAKVDNRSNRYICRFLFILFTFQFNPTQLFQTRIRYDHGSRKLIVKSVPHSKQAWNDETAQVFFLQHKTPYSRSHSFRNLAWSESGYSLDFRGNCYRIYRASGHRVRDWDLEV